MIKMQKLDIRASRCYSLYMEFIERIEAALRASPSFPFAKSCEVACDNVIFDAASDLYHANPVEDWMYREYGNGMDYWYTQARHVFSRMAQAGEL